MSLEEILGEFGSAFLGLLAGGLCIALVWELLYFVSGIL